MQSSTLLQSNSQRIKALADQFIGQIAVPYRLGVIGSTSFWNESSEVICAATGRFLAEFLRARSLKWQNNFALLTGGVTGIAETVARSFQCAWKLLEQDLECDVILSDIDMPYMDGWELLSRLQADEQYKQIPIAMITSREVSHDWASVRSGVWQKCGIPIMTKPYSEEVLSELVELLSRGECLVS